ncbi:MAG: DUF370 domain-containing protein [Clostridiales bacterium]|jgi:hypothetical protein|nr:DUF370 domain-containing protein [Clostridiales bacterium]
MIIHIGFSACVEAGEVVAILDRTAIARHGGGQAFLRRAKQGGCFIPCAEGEQAYVITEKAGTQRVYACAINAKTLQKRVRQNGLHDSRIFNSSSAAPGSLGTVSLREI